MVVKTAHPGDHILVMSNGGFGGIHQKLLDKLAQKAPRQSKPERLPVTALRVRAVLFLPTGRVMLTCESVLSTDSPHFAMLDALYARAFPWHEQRESEAKLQALSHPHYALEAWFDEDVFIGLSGCWQFAGYGYVEHLAIDDTLRSRGYGVNKLLAQILTRAPLTILEIDPLTSEIAHKRLRLSVDGISR